MRHVRTISRTDAHAILRTRPLHRLCSYPLRRERTTQLTRKPRTTQLYTCPKCGQETDLDKSSVVELQRVYHNVKNKKKSKVTLSSNGYKDQDYRDSDKPLSRGKNEPLAYSKNRDVDESQGSKYYPSAPVSQPSYPGAKKNSYQIAYPCSDHADEELTYFCFTCNRPICPECAIHGLHRDH